MKIIDAHCDVLYKMFINQQTDFFRKDPNLDVTFPGLKQANVALQFFAIYLPECISHPTIEHILECIDIFHQRILIDENIVFVKNAKDVEHVLSHNKVGALLSLEGVDALAGNLASLRILHRLGVRAVGITWNHANWAADGVMEPRKGGLTARGRQLVKECERIGMLLDASHLSVKGFWELMELSSKPFIASHSNAYAICPHPRNLADDQIKAIIQMDSILGITFVPSFVYAAAPPTISHLLNHIDYICSLGGARNIGFGSDFDGIEQWLPGLEKVEQYDNLVNELVKRYNIDDVKSFLNGNWQRFLMSQL